MVSLFELLGHMMYSVGMFVNAFMAGVLCYAVYRKAEHYWYMWGQLPMAATDEDRRRIESNKAKFGKHLSRTGRALFCACIGCPNRVSGRYSDRLCYKCVCEKTDWRGSL